MPIFLPFLIPLVLISSAFEAAEMIKEPTPLRKTRPVEGTNLLGMLKLENWKRMWLSIHGIVVPFPFLFTILAMMKMVILYEDEYIRCVPFATSVKTWKNSPAKQRRFPGSWVNDSGVYFEVSFLASHTPVNTPSNSSQTPVNWIEDYKVSRIKVTKLHPCLPN
jgi:hypothetical protein